MNHALSIVGKTAILTIPDKEIDEVVVNGKTMKERHPGKWIIHGEPPWYVIECSECGGKWQHWSGYKLLSFCGNCGADMGGNGK